MSLSTRFLDHQQFLLYYNCSAYQVDAIPIQERRHVFVGILFISLGVLIEVGFRKLYF